MFTLLKKNVYNGKNRNISLWLSASRIHEILVRRLYYYIIYLYHHICNGLYYKNKKKLLKFFTI
nr:hypothetical protein Itr_chr11CG06470 [Ipomoea trifida]